MDNNKSELIKLISEYYEKNGKLYTYIAYGPKILGLNDSELIYNFVQYIPEDKISLYEDAIIKLGDAEWICRYAKNVVGANIDKDCEALIKLESGKYLWKLVNDFSFKKIKYYWEKVRKFNNAEEMLYFAEGFEWHLNNLRREYNQSKKYAAIFGTNPRIKKKYFELDEERFDGFDPEETESLLRDLRVTPKIKARELRIAEIQECMR